MIHGISFILWMCFFSEDVGGFLFLLCILFFADMSLCRFQRGPFDTTMGAPEHLAFEYQCTVSHFSNISSWSMIKSATEVSSYDIL